VFGRRLKKVRTQLGVPQDKLGVLIGLDEGSSSARMSRYESGVHEPPYPTALNIAKALKIPVAYLYCDDDQLAELILLLATVKKKDIGDVREFLLKYSNQDSK